ncbi:MAG: hypothetical protein ISS19_18910 [Bacteroidales bacterium]|nr:hypothetical protein [Bacteroidales bacterium]
MKKINLCLLLFALFFTLLLASCQKEKETQKRQISERDILVTQQLRDFQHTLQLKTTGSMSTEDADWYIEGLLNLEQAYNYHDFINLQFTKDSIILVSSNGMISGEQIEQAYAYFADLLDAYIKSIQS